MSFISYKLESIEFAKHDNYMIFLNTKIYNDVGFCCRFIYSLVFYNTL